MLGKKPSLILIIALIFNTSFSQKASPSGIITGTDHREGLVGVNIILDGTI